MPDQSSAATEHAILQEITAPLDRLPDDPLSIIDAEFPHALRGYDRVAVDEYVQHTRQLVAELQATRSPEAAVRRALERVGEQISGVLQRAHDTAEQITAQSRAEAEDRLQQARTEADQIAGAAEQRVRELDADTDRIWMERQRIVADADDLAGQLRSLARIASERFPNDDEAAGDEAEAAGDEDEAAGDADEEAALIAGMPIEAGAPEVEPEKPEPRDDPQLADVEQTVAFSPLRFSGDEDETAVLPDTDEPTEPVDAPPAPGAGAPPPPRGATDDDSTQVIRPASQAANRRLGQ